MVFSTTVLWKSALGTVAYVVYIKDAVVDEAGNMTGGTVQRVDPFVPEITENIHCLSLPDYFSSSCSVTITVADQTTDTFVKKVLESNTWEELGNEYQEWKSALGTVAYVVFSTTVFSITYCFRLSLGTSSIR